MSDGSHIENERTRLMKRLIAGAEEVEGGQEGNTRIKFYVSYDDVLRYFSTPPNYPLALVPGEPANIVRQAFHGFLSGEHSLAPQDDTGKRFNHPTIMINPRDSSLPAGSIGVMIEADAVMMEALQETLRTEARDRAG